MKQGNSNYNTIPSFKLQVAFGNIVTFDTLKEAYPWPLIIPDRVRFASFIDAR